MGRERTDGGGGGQKNRSTLNLKPLEPLCPHHVNKLNWLRSLTPSSSHIHLRSLIDIHCGGKEAVHSADTLMPLCSLCRPTRRRGPSSVRSAKLCSARPSPYSAIYSSTIVSMSVIPLVCSCEPAHNEYIYPQKQWSNALNGEAAMINQ